MLNRQLILERLDMLRNSVSRLNRFRELSEEAFAANPDNYAIAEHHLRRALECVLDIGRHIVVKKGLGRPRDYRSIIEILGQNQVLPPAFARSIMGMAGYRNRLVHGYAEVTGQEMYQIITSRLEDFARFAGYILEYLESQGQSPKAE